MAAVAGTNTVASAPSSTKSVDGKVPLVLVSGATGYVGSWCVNTLLGAGYRVRGTVRSLTSKKVEVLKSLPGAHERLELVTADLMQPADKWKPLVAECDYVLHVASPFFVSDNEDELVKPAVSGTRVVLQAAKETPSVKRVVLTASMASIMYGHGNLNKKTWTPEDFSVPDGPDIDAYCKSKTLAEQEAWKIVRGEGDYAKDGPAKFDLATIHPGLITGPVLGNIGKFTSMDILMQVLDGNSLVDGGFPSVDVRDVARAHVLAMVTPAAGGKRFITTHSAVPILDVQKALAAEFNDKGYSVSTGLTPTWLINCLACCVKQAAAAQSLIGKFPQVDSSATQSVLGLRFKGQLDSYVDMGHSAIQHGYAEDKSKDKSLSEKQPGLMEPFVDGLRIKGSEAGEDRAGAAAKGGAEEGGK